MFTPRHPSTPAHNCPQLCAGEKEAAEKKQKASLKKAEKKIDKPLKKKTKSIRIRRGVKLRVRGRPAFMLLCSVMHNTIIHVLFTMASSGSLQTESFACCVKRHVSINVWAPGLSYRARAHTVQSYRRRAQYMLFLCL
eukprot:1159274-Pelagomonas_calceolata.AAC.3